VCVCVLSGWLRWPHLAHISNVHAHIGNVHAHVGNVHAHTGISAGQHGGEPRSPELWYERTLMASEDDHQLRERSTGTVRFPDTHQATSLQLVKN